ncbi:HAMP domain-containing histidine kinase [Tumebacillus sp. ITR2]|uniref:histidine kinase n=1 Tax=Tumebacillus amylolyticus TaxID=2801339 RepID=A0ABS1J4P8_9BACL|nr:HAMP domain-containing sensor histidine kinase [Tumebacillus amylolyticus]MBL0385255.1 HAMP domain-containing histidine kinase [Tumebacillus amylolyticus]
MFKKTKLRLVLLNTLVFFLLLTAFSTTLYLYTKERLYSQTDHNLQDNAQHFLNDASHGQLDRRPLDQGREAERRVVYVLWDDKGNAALQMPEGALFQEDMEKLSPDPDHDGDPKKPPGKGQPGQFHTVSIGGNDYRVYNVPVQMKMANGTSIQTLQLLTGLQQSQEMMTSMLWVIIVAGAVCALVAVGAGVYLATRALRPIQQAWNKQQEFVADASHELRTPLTVMKTSLERLFRHPDNTIEQESVGISDAIEETNRMSKLVSQLLTLARSDSNELEILRQPMRVDELVGRMVERFREFAMLKDIEIHSSLDELPVEILGDEERLQQLLVILLDNALKYTEESGRVHVTCRKTANHVQIEVTDTGIGISAEDLPRIFDRFFRGDKMRARTHPGTGLGLSIAQWIVEAHGGKIRAESVPGQGTTISVRLPARG